MKKISKDSSCAIKAGGTGKFPNTSRMHRFKTGFRWQGVKDLPYKASGSDWSDIVRRVIIGSHGETTKFEVRYFEISGGGRSSFEMHRHEHVVICVRGRGLVRVGKRSYAMGFMDTMYIAPNAPHQLLNPHRAPFGFLCIVNARRDRPKILREG